jgi:NAD(P)-dependent dehydrogenase (short-subunit alcohol dehydrogenase family)
MRDITGKIAFVTGGASGIGLGIVKALVRRGARVAVADVRADALQAAAAEVSQTATVVYPVVLDVTDRAEWVSAVDATERALGPVDLLFNNAGVSSVGPLQSATYDDWDFVLGVCLGGVINGIQTLVPRMIARGEAAHIINTSSTSGTFASGQLGPYIAAKFAVTGLSETLAGDLAEHGIRVSTFFPGPVMTNLAASSQIVRPDHLTSSGFEPRPWADRRAATPDIFMRPEEAGERVLQGVERDDLFIFTHAEFRQGIEARHNAMMRAIPDEHPHEERKALLRTLGPFLDNPIYRTQTARGRYEPSDNL